MERITQTAAASSAAGAAFVPGTPEAHRVEVNGMQVYYEVSGEGEPLIVLHGAYMNIPKMGAIIGRLAETHKVYAFEAQGHGRTTDIDRPITTTALAGDIAAFMDAVGIEKADIFGYSMGAITGLRFAIDYPERVKRLISASGAFAFAGRQPAFQAAIRQLKVEQFTASPLAADYKKLAPNPEGFPALVEKMIASQQQPMAWGEDVAKLKAPVLIIAGDADGVTLEHYVEMLRLLGGGEMGDTGKPLAASRLAILPGSSHTSVIGQVDVMMQFITPFLTGETAKGWFN